MTALSRLLLCFVLGMLVGSMTLLPQPYSTIVVSLVTANLLWAGLHEHDRK